ncbi:type III secretion protein [Paraburkholderia sp. BCC1885]|uniref:type III secretion protein n=1 Tax=Paraburkholderia sp. BCC1885 TaxID=2562669 RepID=UPI001184273A|nr:type III secretion protein [Paraburkholderia sp. BCC1885]
MKLLRILTGVHAGAQLQLTPGTHRIGADDDADIRLADWRGADTLLHVDASGVVSAQRLAPDHASAPQAANTDAALANSSPNLPVTQEEVILLVDFVPMQFDDTILCIGADDAAWPSDLDLLSTLLTRPAEARFAAERKKRHRYVGAVVACFALGIVIVAVSLLTTTQMSRAALPHNADERAERVSEALAAAHVSGLHAHALGSTVVVTGMVATAADDEAVRTLLERIAENGISRNYDVAQNDARSIEDSLGIAGAHVEYQGGGTFAVTGKVSSRASLDAALARVRADLDANVRGIVVQASETAGAVDAPAEASYSEMISSDDVKYAETPDGVKHIYAVDPPAGASDSDAAAANAANAASAASTATAANVNATSSTDNDTVSRSADAGVPLPDPATLPAAAAPSSARQHGPAG